MSDSHPEFLLWFPRRETAGTETVYSFDVVRTCGSQVHEGTTEVCRAFLQAWGVQRPQVTGWQVERVCTTFFTEDPSEPDWLARYRVSWRIRIRVGEGAAEMSGGSPAYADGYDTTEPQAPSLRPGRETCEVVAVEPGIGRPLLEPRLRDRFPGAPVIIREIIDGGLPLRVARIALGTLVVEQEVPRLDAARETCRELGLIVDIPGLDHLRATLPRNEVSGRRR